MLGPHTGAPGDSQLVDDAQTDTSWGSVTGRLSSKNCWAHFQLLTEVAGNDQYFKFLKIRLHLILESKVARV